MPQRAARAVCFAALVTLVGCVPQGTRFEPLPMYQEWWQEAATCLQDSSNADLTRITWYVEDVPLLKCAGKYALGCWRWPHYISVVRSRIDARQTIVHEMMHDRLRGDREHAHPAFGFCGF